MDRTVDELVAALGINNEDSFLLQQDGEAKKLTGEMLTNWLKKYVQKGDTPVLIKTNVYYAVSPDGSKHPEDFWQPDIPAVIPQGQYLWTSFQFVFDTGESSWVYMSARSGIDGKGSVSSVNGISPDAGGNVSLAVTELIYTNPAPSTEFGKVTLNYDLSKYDLIVVAFGISTDYDYILHSEIALVGTSCSASYTDDQGIKSNRAFSVAYNSISFEQGVKGKLTNDTVLIPHYIYGIRKA